MVTRKRGVVLAVALSLVLVVGVVAYLWPSVTLPLVVKEPIEILDYSPVSLELFPGETENISILVRNLAPVNYTVVFDFQLNDTAYQNNFVRFSDEEHNVPPGEHSFFTWLRVEPSAPPVDATLRINVQRIKSGVSPPSSLPDLLEENWDTLGSWRIDPRSILVEINPPGQLHAVGFVVRQMMFPLRFTVEFRLKVDSFVGGDAMLQTYTSRSSRVLRISADRIRLWVVDDQAEEFFISTNNDWHVWRIVFDEGIQETTIYRDGILLTTFTGAEIRSDLLQRIYVGSLNGETHWDYLYIYSGLRP